MRLTLGLLVMAGPALASPLPDEEPESKGRTELALGGTIVTGAVRDGVPNDGRRFVGAGFVVSVARTDVVESLGLGVQADYSATLIEHWSHYRRFRVLAFKDWSRERPDKRTVLRLGLGLDRLDGRYEYMDDIYTAPSFGLTAALGATQQWSAGPFYLGVQLWVPVSLQATGGPANGGQAYTPLSIAAEFRFVIRIR